MAIRRKRLIATCHSRRKECALQSHGMSLAFTPTSTQHTSMISHNTAHAASGHGAHLGRTLLAALILLAISVTACGFPVSVDDDRGTQLTFSAAPDRVVTIVALYAEILVHLGAQERIVAMADSPDNPEVLDGLPSVGTAFAPSVEAILGVEPDLVLGAWGEVRDALERMGTPVLTLGGPGGYIGTVGKILAVIRELGEVFGVAEQAAHLVGEIAVSIVETESVVLGRAPVRAAFLYVLGPDTPPYAMGRDSTEHELLLRAGGTNVFADLQGFPQVSVEEVLARDPEVIFTDPTQVEHIVTSHRLARTTAVTEGRVYGIGAAETTAVRVAEALQRMAQYLHPEAFE